MRFGAFVPQGWRLDLAGLPRDQHWQAIAGVAGTIEEVGFESGWVYDHFHTVPIPTQQVTYEAWTLMGALAVVTNRLRLGQMCTSNSYRNPAYLAKVAASVDVISEGRLEMGLGAGWYEHEYIGYGYEFPRPSVRIGQLEEACEIMKRMWTEEEVHFQGRYYTLAGAICQPKPMQRPYIPLWVAGGGEQLTLRVAARYADYTNFGPGLEQFRRKSNLLSKYCQELGRDFEGIVRSALFNVLIGESEPEIEERRRWLHDHFAPHLPPDRVSRLDALWRGELVDAPTALIGTPEQIATRLESWHGEGMGYAICYFPEAAFDDSGLRLFAKQMIPVLPS